MTQAVETQRELGEAPAKSPWGRLLRNTGYTFLARVVAAAIALAVLPFVVRTLGTEMYGVWVLVFLLTNYVGLADLGIGAAFVRHIAEDYAKRDFRALNQVVNTGIVFYVCFWIIAASIVCLFLAPPLLSLFKVSSTIWGEAHFALIGAVLIFAATNCMSVFPAVLNGLQRMELSNSIVIGHSLLTAAGMVFVLRQGLGIRGLIFNAGLMFVLAAFANVICASRVLPQLRINPLLATRKSFRRLFSFGVKMQGISALAVFSRQFDRALTGYALSLRYLGMYQIGSRAAEMITNLCVSIYQPVVPAASDLAARKEHTAIRQLHRRGTRWLVLATVPLLAAGLVNAPEAVRLWMGPGFEVSAVVLQCVFFAYSINILLTGMGTSMLRGLGKPEAELKTGAFFTVVTLSMGVPLALWLGLPGILITVISAQTGCSLFFIYLFHRTMKWSLREFALQVLLPPAIAGGLASALGLGLRHILLSLTSGPTKPVLLLTTLANGLTTAAICIGLLVVMRYFEKEDYTLVREASRKLRNAFSLSRGPQLKPTTDDSRGETASPTAPGRNGKPLRIAFVMPSKPRTPGGGAKIICGYANHLSARGHQVYLVFPPPVRAEREGRRSWAQRRLWHLQDRLLGRVGVEWFPLAEEVRQLYLPRVDDSHLPPCDVVVATLWRTAEWVGALTRPGLKRFYLIQGHEKFCGPEERVEATWTLPLEKMVISKWLLQFAREMGESAYHLPNPVDLEEFRMATSPEERNCHTIGLAWSSAPWKASEDAFSALSQVRQQCPQLEVLAWGPSVKKGMIPDFVTYFPTPSQSALSALYNRCSIFLVSSLEEGWGLPGAEAMACGCALVSTDTKGVRDYACHEETALISEPGKPDQLAENLMRLLEDDPLRIRLARAGHQALQSFTWQKAVDRFEAILEGRDILTAPSATAAAPQHRSEEPGP